MEPSLCDSKEVVVEAPSRDREDSSVLGAFLGICSESEFVLQVV